MNSNTRIRAKARKGVIVVRAMIPHPMETGYRLDEASGESVPAHFVTDVELEHNGQIVAHAQLNTSVAKNPYISFKCLGESGDQVRVVWRDNRGGSGFGKAQVK